ASASAPPAKRPKTAPSAPAFGCSALEVPGRVRVRQILLRTWREGTPQPQDPVRRKPVKRSQEQAELQLLQVLADLGSLSGLSLAKGFSAACKASSECPSSLQGGELSGDLGFLDKEKGVDTKRANGQMVKSAVPAAVLKAAFTLEVGELGDLVVSELGVHLLLRSA
ncbi:unnamed protein product, partial [Polarella glacialis]